MTDEPQGTLYIGTKWYEVDVNKLRKSSMTDAAYLFASLRVNEDYEHFDKVKHLLIIPEEPKSLEDLSQELEEKIDVLIAKTIAKFECSKETAEYYYNERFDRIFSNFQYAKEHGHFPEVRFAKIGRIDYSKLSVSGGYAPSFVIKQGEKHDGYYTNGNRRYFKYYMPDKPNVIVRFFMRTCLGFWWVDEKDT